MELQEVIEKLTKGCYRAEAKVLYSEIYEEDARKGNYDIKALDFFSELLMREDLADYLKVAYDFTDEDISFLFWMSDEYYQEEEVIDYLSRITIVLEFAICHNNHKQSLT